MRRQKKRRRTAASHAPTASDSSDSEPTPVSTVADMEAWPDHLKPTQRSGQACGKCGATNATGDHNNAASCPHKTMSYLLKHHGMDTALANLNLPDDGVLQFLCTTVGSTTTDSTTAPTTTSTTVGSTTTDSTTAPTTTKSCAMRRRRRARSGLIPTISALSSSFRCMLTLLTAEPTNTG
jgi:hypothetical protein